MKFKAEETNDGQHFVFVTRVKLDEGETRVAQEWFNYENEAIVEFIDPDAASKEIGESYNKALDRVMPPRSEQDNRTEEGIGKFFEWFSKPVLLLKSAGNPAELNNSSTLKMEPTLDDGEDPLITIGLSGEFRDLTHECIPQTE